MKRRSYLASWQNYLDSHPAAAEAHAAIWDSDRNWFRDEAVLGGFEAKTTPNEPEQTSKPSHEQKFNIEKTLEIPGGCERKWVDFTKLKV